MKPEMRRQLARLPYPEKLRRVAELIELSRQMKRTRLAPEPRLYSAEETAVMLAEDDADEARFRRKAPKPPTSAPCAAPTSAP